jgi:hypothetical protein
MPRAQLLIEGFAPGELLELAKTTSLLPLFAAEPVCVAYGRLKALVQKIARARGIEKVDFELPTG